MLLHDISCTDPADMFNKDLADKARYFKETDEGVEAVCKVMDDVRNEARFKAILENLKTVMERLGGTADAAMDFLKIPKEERELYRPYLQH